jgi:hypothetical protein
VSGAAATEVDATTVEEVIRHQLSKALGGARGMAEGAIPTIGFTVVYVITHELRPALLVGAGLAVAALLIRIVQRQSVQFVVNAMVGIAIAAAFALRSGKAEDAFLPGIIYNAAYAVVMTVSVLARWPVVGLMIGSVTGDLTSWRQDPGVLKLCSRLSWLLILPCAARVAVQYPLYLAGEVGWLGAAKVALGWPLQVAALSAMVLLLARGHTPLNPPAETPVNPPSADVGS